MQINNGITMNCAWQSLLLRCLLVTTMVLAVVSPVTATPLLESYMTQLREQGHLSVEGQTLAAVRALPAFYAARDHQPVWTSAERLNDMLRVIENASSDGLDPDDYHAMTLRDLAVQGDLGEEQGAHRELLLTDALMRLVYHLEFGKVNPDKLFGNWQFTKQIDGLDPTVLIETILAAFEMDDRSRHRRMRLCRTKKKPARRAGEVPFRMRLSASRTGSGRERRAGRTSCARRSGHRG